MFERLIKKLLLTFKEIIIEIKEHRYSLLFYLISVIYLVILDVNNIGGRYLYLGFLMFSIGCLIWILKYYEKIKENTSFKILYYIITSFSVAFASILSDLAIVEHTGLPATDYPNTLILVTTMSYIPILSVLLAAILIIGIFAFFFARMLREVLVLHNKLFFNIFNFCIQKKKNNLVKDFVFLLHFLGVFCVYVLSSSYLNLLNKENPFILNVVSMLDYKYLYNYPNIDHNEKVVIHNGNFYSVIKIKDDGFKYIKIMKFQNNN